MLTQEELIDAIPHALRDADIPELGAKHAGKVRDSYQKDGQRILITTDRISAFDQVLGVIPYKGQILNQLSAWWFQQTCDIIPNHIAAIPDPNVSIVHEATPLPVEVIVRGYITGSTSTSLWYLYQQGERHPYGISLPDGLSKNDPLPHPIITPTTKAAAGQHDQQLTRDDIITQGILPEERWQLIETVALALFNRGQKIAHAAGLILVDTKYEFGVVDGNRLMLIDEIHTPDSSRYWSVESHQQTPHAPEHYDKEYLRLWYAKQGYRGQGTPPPLPDTIAAQTAQRYITTYERITGTSFAPAEQPALERIRRNLDG
jgi:phosphoribosylaminoimidazole-succinocarboxamide synthase